MKKLFIAATLFATSIFSVNAQDDATLEGKGPIMSKRGYPILPEAGDYSLGFSAIPLLNYVGNVFSDGGADNNPIGFANPGYFTNYITGRKFIDANTAYRATVGINLSSVSTKNLVIDNTNTGTTPTYVEDKRSVSSTGIILGAGLEKRKGNHRVQGIYGAQALIGYGSGRTKFEYGNSFSAANPTPTSTSDFNNGTSGATGTRTTLSKGGSSFLIGAVGFVGVEYFFAPKISIGAEYQWGPVVTLTGKGKNETESFTNGAVQTTETETAGGSSLNLNTGLVGINLNFFF